ncbi:hypothetical protein LJR118_003454 [Acidovorax sp. LjRoot118]|uniref:hypothetical protein n=1 Tax=Acidovorax sp. LjRoot118 TaxID=3342256 RepID=UPI0015C6AD8D
MPTELLLPGSSPWVLLRGALSDVDRREANAVQLLRAALLVCLSPIDVQTN